MTDEHNPWERQPWDTSASFQAFRVYLEQEAPRSVVEAYRQKTGKEKAKVSQAPGGWNNWAGGKDYKGDPIPDALPWAKRAEAWDDHLAEQDILKWEQRRAEQREREWGTSNTLFDKAQQMLKFPVVETTTKDGQTIVKPAKWTFRDAAAIADLASKLARLAAEMETEKRKTEHSGPDGGPIVTEERKPDLSKLSDDELRSLRDLHTKLEG